MEEEEEESDLQGFITVADVGFPGWCSVFPPSLLFLRVEKAFDSLKTAVWSRLKIGHALGSCRPGALAPEKFPLQAGLSIILVACAGGISFEDVVIKDGSLLLGALPPGLLPNLPVGT